MCRAHAHLGCVKGTASAVVSSSGSVGRHDTRGAVIVRAHSTHRTKVRGAVQTESLEKAVCRGVTTFWPSKHPSARHPKQAAVWTAMLPVELVMLQCQPHVTVEILTSFAHVGYTSLIPRAISGAGR